MASACRTDWGARAEGGGRRHTAVVPAAGVGTRLGADRPKQYLVAQGRTLLEHTVQALQRASWWDKIVVVVAPNDRVAQTLPGLQGSQVHVVPVGGASRRDSVLAGLQWLDASGGAAAHDWIWVHDAARPGVDEVALQRLHAVLAEQPCGALLALPVADTLKHVASADHVTTLDRTGMWLAQTPQVFPFSPLMDALTRHRAVTDEASAFEAGGAHPVLVPGNRQNFKVTTMDDWQAMQHTLARVSSAPVAVPGWRIGQGWDVHVLVAGRPLIIGGVTIPYERGLLGHSDADVLLHAITDAVLGAAALGDIGRHFPDTDARFAGADSQVLLREAVSRAHAAGWQINNIDATVVAQAPRLAPFIPAMVQRISAACALPEGRVNIKAKTAERLGFAGRGEGIEAHASVLMHAFSGPPDAP